MRSDVTRPVRLILLTLLIQLLAGCACGDCTDDDGDGFTTCDGDCNDSNPSVYPDALEICNGLDDDCSGLADQSFDRDADGHLETASCPGVVGADDCDDNDPLVNGGAAELCDDTDHNCDGDPHAGATGAADFCPDTDEDGYPNGAAVSNCGGDGWADCALETDCDDAAPGINPGVTETCDGSDEDCVDGPDNGFDVDGDGVTSCGTDGSSPSSDDDCDDNDDQRYPGNAEACDGLDNDCDGIVDNGFDGDADGYFDDSDAGCVATYGDQADCNDASNAQNPGQSEACDGIDNDCNGQTDDNTSIQDWYPDSDNDTFGDDDAAPTSSCTPPTGLFVLVQGDCDDGQSTVNPLGIEVCDGVDNDCLNGIDDTFDGDQDQAFDSTDSGCLATYGAAADCDDAEAATFPGATEACDGEDNDCDSQTPADETDEDGDNYVECSPYLGVGFLGGDCNDDPSNGGVDVNPGATEVCDGVDNDCANGIDDGQLDADGDGVAGCVDCDDLPPLCTDPAQLTEADCTTAGATWNLNGAANFPGNIEICDGIDNDCLDGVDEDTVDRDGDGATPCGTDGQPNTGDEDCNDLDAAWNADDLDGDGYSNCAGDCNEDSPLVNPGEPEYCDTVDNDCNGNADPANALVDGDGDGFVGTDCIDPATSAAGTDCDDSNSAVFPVLEYTSGMQRQCKPAVYPGFSHQWHQFEASNPNYFFDPDPANPTPHYLYFRGMRTPTERSFGLVASVDGITWPAPAATPMFERSASGWDSTKIAAPSVIYVPSLIGGEVPDRPYLMGYSGVNTINGGEDIGIATATNPEGPFTRVGLDGITSQTGPVLEHGVCAQCLGGVSDLDDVFAAHPFLYRDSSGVLFMWYTGKSASGFNILYATSTDGSTWQKFDTTAEGVPDTLLSQGTSGDWDDTKVLFPTVHRNADPTSTQTFEVWYNGFSGVTQGGVARGQNSIAWEKHPLNPCLPAYSDTSRFDGKSLAKLDSRFEPDSDPAVAAAGGGIYHIYYHAKVDHSTTSLQGEIYGTAAGNSKADVHYIGYAVNNAPRLTFTSPAENAAISSPLDLAGTVTDNAPETVLLTLSIDGFEQQDVAAITAGDPGDFGVQTTDFTFSQIDLTQVTLDGNGTIGALSAGTHVFKVVVSDAGGAERSATIALNVP